MAKKKLVLPPIDPKHWWVCEKCRSIWEGVNPPDECSYDGYTYFENMYDIDPTFGQEVTSELN
jgi:rubrerythrin